MYNIEFTFIRRKIPAGPKISNNRVYSNSKCFITTSPRSESRIPLARWELQHPTNIIQESDTELPIFGPDPRPPSDLEEEGSASSKSDHESINKSSDSLSSSEGSKGDKKEGEEVEVPVKVIRGVILSLSLIISFHVYIISCRLYKCVMRVET